MTVLEENDWAWDCKMVVLKVHLRQRQISVKFRIQVKAEYLEMATKALKIFHVQHPLFVKQGFLQW